MQIKDSKLETDRGKVIGIGRVKIPSMSEFNHEIPLLSFVVIKRNDPTAEESEVSKRINENKKYISSCIHLQIDGYGKTVEDAQVDMIDNILYFLSENFNNSLYAESCWENILSLFEANETSSLLWDKYHAFQIMLAEKGCTTDRFSQLLRRLLNKIELLENKVKELEEKIKKIEGHKNNLGNIFINALKDTEKMLIVEYISGYQEAL